MSNHKPFEHIEEKIRQAAEISQPDFVAEAWNKMEALLNKEKKRRPVFWWWWFVLPLFLAGAWGVYKIAQPSAASEKPTHNIALPNAGNKPDIPAVKRQKTISLTEDASLPVASTNGFKNKSVPKRKQITASGQQMYTAGQQKIIPTNENTAARAPFVKSIVTGSKTDNEVVNKKNRDIPPFVKNVAAGKKSEIENIVASSNGFTAASPEKKTEEDIKKTAAAAQQNKPVEKINAVPSTQNGQQDSFKTTALLQKENKKDPGIAGNKNAMAKHTNKAVKSFYLLASAGTDAGSVAIFSFTNSTITAKYGIGIGYQLNNKWSAQTGFYISNKKYTAGANDYHPKEGSYWNLVQLQEIDAACLVYEIPVTVKYNFLQKPAITYFAAIGASSFIMKKEDYNYSYTRYNEPYKKYGEYTGNAHLFSSITFSAGIEKKLSSQFSFLAEPSCSIPLSGVGDGRVKLFSAALQIAVKFQPFQKQK